MKKSTPVAKSPRYTKLISELKPLLRATTQTGSQALNALSLDSYWRMGRKLNSYPDDSPGLFISIAKDLKIERTLLYRIRKFHDTWTDGLTPEAKKLAWRKHLVLIGLSSKPRDFYVKLALAKGLRSEDLRRCLLQDYYTHAHTEPDNSSPLLSRDPDPLHIYKAKLIKVVDGDTLDIQIDLGFSTASLQRLRLRGINTSELDKPNKPSANSGRAVRAKAFVEEKLTPLSFIVVKTYQTDIYGRYITDVFYHPNFTDKRDVAMKGYYLNEELLREGLAEVMLG